MMPDAVSPSYGDPRGCSFKFFVAGYSWLVSPWGELNLAHWKVGLDLIRSEIEFDIHSS